jgi:integration host factor subunit alpha
MKEKAEHRGRNPTTDEDLILALRKSLNFKCSGKLREGINK